MISLICRIPHFRLALLFLISFSVWFLESSTAWAYNAQHLQQLLETNNCPNCDLQGVILEHEHLAGADLSGANLESAIFFNVNLERANLTGANLQYAEFNKSEMQRCQLQNANLQFAKFRRTDFERSQFKNANLSHTQIRNSTFKEANLTNAIMKNASIIGADFKEVQATGLNLSGSKIIGVDMDYSEFQYSIWKDVKLIAVDLSGSNFLGAQMQNLSFNGGNLRSANFMNANLSNATLFNGNFSMIKFINTNLQQAEISFGDLRKSEFTGAKIDGFSVKAIDSRDMVWIDGSTMIPQSIREAAHDSIDTKKWITETIEKNSDDIISLIAVFLPDSNMVIVPAALSISFGLFSIIFFMRRRDNLLFDFGVILLSLGLTLLIFTEFLIKTLAVGYLWEVFMISAVCFTAGTICGFMDALFGRNIRKVVRFLWWFHGIATLIFIGGSAVIYHQPTGLMLPWIKVAEMGVMLLLFAIYMLLPWIAVMKGFKRRNPDARIVVITFTIMLILSIPLFVEKSTVSLQLSMLGGLIFLCAPGMIIFRRELKVQHKLESYSKELEEQSKNLETKNRELSRLDELKDEFLANTSHELRTPLNGMIGITESMLDGATGTLSESQRQQLAMVSISSRRLSHLVNDLLDFSRLKHKHIELRTKSIDLRTMCQLILTLSEPLLKNKEIELVNDIPSNIPGVEADEDRLQQIFHNLIGNAVKFTPQGKITISAKVKKNDVEITVSDTGIGIPSDKLEQIFESFEQADGSTAREYGGTGLGLAITRQLVELHGGKVWVKSKLEQGSTFHFTLPVGSQEKGANASTQSLSEGVRYFEEEISESIYQANPSDVQTAGDHNYHILAVDDDPINLQVLVNHLSLHNYQVTLASNGEEALNLINKGNSFDLVLLDIMMPKMTGYELCERIRENFPAHHLPILLLTAKNQVSELMTGFNVGANDFLTKPISKNELLPRIRTHIQLSKINLAYSRFVPSEFLQLLGKENIVEVELGDFVKKEMSIMFADIRSFTTLSETMTPEETFRFINSYLSEMEPVILEQGGIIDKFIGDAIMVLFDNADNAVKAGYESVFEEVIHFLRWALLKSRWPLH